MMIYGEGVGSMYSTIVEGRKRELQAQRLSQPEIEDIIGKFAVDVKFYKRNDFDELYELYKEMIHSATGTRKVKGKK